MNKSVAISIGNTDGRLTHREWEQYVSEVNHILSMNTRIHFFGGPPNYSQYQNVCWFVDVNANYIPSLKAVLREIRWKYKQESVAWLEGETEFI